MTLSYSLAYQEIISVHPTRRQICAGKPYSTFWNIWDLLISHLRARQGPQTKTKQHISIMFGFQARFNILYGIGHLSIGQLSIGQLSIGQLSIGQLSRGQLSIRAQWDFKNCLEELAHMFFNVKLNFKVGFFWIFFDLSTPWGRKMHICKCMGISMGKWPKKINWPKITFLGSKMVPKLSKWEF